RPSRLLPALRLLCRTGQKPVVPVLGRRLYGAGARAGCPLGGRRGVRVRLAVRGGLV
ncbi:MAG: hypothetical protein AVDCRST_MAG05-3406, partial [uncultured Rubrobacteraceae bacterium]